MCELFGYRPKRKRDRRLAKSVAISRRKPRLRTELSEADERCLLQAAAMFGLPKAEVVRRLIRASVQAGPALSAENSQAVIELARQVRIVGRTLAQILKAIHEGRCAAFEDAATVWRELLAIVAEINDELTAITVVSGARLRRAAKLSPAEQRA